MKKRIISTLIILFVLCNIVLGTYALSPLPQYGYNNISKAAQTALDNGQSYVPRTVSINNSYAYVLKGSTTYPSFYSSAQLGYTSGVDNQDSTSLCWAFTHNEVIETYVAKHTGVKLDYSEQAMKFETSYKTNSESGYARTPNGSGNEYISTGYLARTGSVLEADEPFSNSTVRKVDATTLQRDGYLTSVPMYEYGLYYDADAVLKIKELVTEYGAVGTSVLYDSTTKAYENASRTNYYYNGPSSLPNHAVTIVGWDDAYSASNFTNKPAGNGAFIVKNSWGNYHNRGTSDLFYVSYYDKFITYQFFTSSYEATNDLFENIYSYDDYGWYTNGYVESDSVMFGTKFYTETVNETINAVGIYVPHPDVYVEVMLNTTGSGIENADDYVSVYSKQHTDAGFFLIQFDEVNLPYGEFDVMVRFTYPKIAIRAEFAIQMRDSSLTPNAVNVPDTCYFGTTFSNLKAIEDAFKNTEAMNCIKAYTSKRSDITHVDSAEKFTDVDYSNWYKKAVDYAASYGIMTGVSDSEFKPNSQMTRAQFVQVLANMTEGYDAEYYSYHTGVFTDVTMKNWYNSAVQWAYENGIVNGVSHNKFAPNQGITRQQMCVMLVRYMDVIGIELNVTATGVMFSDHNDIQAYAIDAVYLCKNAGIINGVTKTEFKPKNGATRAQIAQMMTNLCQRYL